MIAPICHVHWLLCVGCGLISGIYNVRDMLSWVKSSWCFGLIVSPPQNHIPLLVSNFITMLCSGFRSSSFQGQDNCTAVPASGHQGGAHHGARSARVCPALLAVSSPLTPTALCISPRSVCVCGCVQRLSFSFNSLSIDYSAGKMWLMVPHRQCVCCKPLTESTLNLLNPD